MLTLAIPIQVSARLIVLPPEKMLAEATIIVTGEVTKIEKGANSAEENVGIIEIDKILKGTIDTNILTIKGHKYITNTLLQGLPPVGTKVFVLLKENENNKPYFFADGNHIGVIKDDSVVEIYKGINVKIHPYVEKYNEYYQKHKDNAILPSIRLDENKSVKNYSVKDNNELTAVKGNRITAKSKYSVTVLVLIFLDLMIFIILFILVRKKQKR